MWTWTEVPLCALGQACMSFYKYSLCQYGYLCQDRLTSYSLVVSVCVPLWVTFLPC